MTTKLTATFSPMSNLSSRMTMLKLLWIRMLELELGLLVNRLSKTSKCRLIMRR